MAQRKMIVIGVALCLLVFGGALYIGSIGDPSIPVDTLVEQDQASAAEASATEAGGPPLPNPEDLSELDVMALLNRELALSSDRVMGTSNKGFCGQDFHSLGQLLRALRSSLDFSGITQEEIQVVLVKFPLCDEACEKKVCESNYFKDLVARKDKYGSPEDGH